MKLGTGYVDSYSENLSREQVIIVVWDDLTILCYSGELKLLWKKTLAHKSHQLSKLSNMIDVNDITLSIGPFNIAENSTGIVILGASMKLKENNELKIRVEFGMDLNQSGIAEHPELQARSKLEHFSIYSMDGHTGKLLWKHEGMEVRSEQLSKSLPQHAYGLDMHDLIVKSHHAPGLSDWNLFRSSLLAELPHVWNEPSDSSMRIAYFEKHHIGARPSKPVKSNSVSNVRNQSGKESKGATPKMVPKSGILKYNQVSSTLVPDGSALPHSAVEHIEHPNVVVAHTESGIEVVALRSGIPITSLALKTHQTFADVDGNGVVDAIIVIENAESANIHDNQYTNPYGKLHHCMILAVSGIPAQSQLFNGSICQERVKLRDSLDVGNSFDGTEFQPYLKKKGKSTLATIPTEVRYVGPLVLNRGTSNKMKKFKDVIVAVNTGIITSYSGLGVFNWQVKGGPTWSLEDSKASIVAYDPDEIRVEDFGTHENMYANILVVGEAEMQLYSSEGVFLASADLPQKVISKPILADFDNDGVVDIILLTKDAVLGYHLNVSRSTHWVVVALLILVAIAVVVFVASIQKAQSSELPLNVRDGVPFRSKAGVFTIVRSTDEHLD